MVQSNQDGPQTKINVCGFPNGPDGIVTLYRPTNMVHSLRTIHVV